MLRLKKTVRAGGVTYPAGTPATPELRELINPRHWSEGDPRTSGSTSPGVDPAQVEEELSQLRELAATEIEARDATIAELQAEVERLTAELEQTKTGPDPEPVKVDYLEKTARELKDAIDARNADRDPAGEAYIRVEPPGNKPELAAALEADDRRSGGS